MKNILYRISYPSLMGDKGKDFDVKPEVFHECIRGGTMGEKKLYFMNSDGLTLFYTLIIALEESKS